MMRPLKILRGTHAISAVLALISLHGILQAQLLKERSPAAVASASAGSAVAEQLITAIEEAIERAQFAGRPQVPAIEAMLKQAEALEAALNKHSLKIPPEYRGELDAMAVRVSTLDWKSPDYSASDLITLMTRDLRVKTSYLQNTNGGFAFQKSLEVLVSVITRQGPGYQVSFNPLRYEGKASARFPVASLTNAASRLLPPGLYVMTLERDGKRSTQEVEIGEAGADTQKIEVGP